MIFWLKSNIERILISFLMVLIVVFLHVVFFETVEDYISQLIGVNEKNSTLTFLGISMGGVLIALQAVIANRRAEAMEKAAIAQAKATEEQAKGNQNAERGLRQERLKNAIEHLGHDSVSIRLGGAYELFHLAQDTVEMRQTVLDILCSHIRRTTSESKYRKENESEPSEEIQSLLTLLFVKDQDTFKGLNIHLPGCWLKGADFTKASLEMAFLSKAHLENADFDTAQLQKADLFHANLKGARFYKTQMQKVRLTIAQMQGTWFDHAHLQGANLNGAKLQGAWMDEVQLQGAYLRRAQLLNVWLRNSQLQGANLEGVNLQLADLTGAKLQGAFLKETNLQEATLEGVSLEGVISQSRISPSFETRIKERTEKESDLSQVIFAGGLTQKKFDVLVKGLSDKTALEIKTSLLPHFDKPNDNNLTEASGAIVGYYTKEEADKWIAEYEDALSEKSEDD